MLTSYRIYGKGQNSYFLKHSFSALGVTFSNILSINEIANINYITKIEKAKSLVQIWSQKESHAARKGNNYKITSPLLNYIYHCTTPKAKCFWLVKSPEATIFSNTFGNVFINFKVHIP